MTDSYGAKVAFTNTPLTAEEMGDNKDFSVSVDGEVVYDRLNADKSTRTDADPNPSEDGGKANAGGSWGPIILPGGENDWWGAATTGKLAAIKAAIDAKM
jgi:hypothetical protein